MVDPLDSVSCRHPAGTRSAPSINPQDVLNCAARNDLRQDHQPAASCSSRQSPRTCPDMVMEDLLTQSEQARSATAIDILRGHEGQAAALYFANFAGMFKSSLANEFDANGRQRRPPPDPINAVLSFAYTMLSHECVSALRLARLEPSIGAFHTCRPGRPALALDLMEPFRPLIADSVAVSCFQSRRADRRPLPSHRRRLRPDRLRPSRLLRRLGPKNGHGSHPSRLRLQAQLPPNAHAPRQNDRRVAPERSPHAGVLTTR